MSTHNIGFYEDLTKLSFNYHQIRTLSLLLVLKSQSTPKKSIFFITNIQRFYVRDLLIKFYSHLMLETFSNTNLQRLDLRNHLM